MRHLLSCMCCWMLAAAAGLAGDTELWIGDDAPGLDGAEWVAGQPVDAFARRQVYVVDFWSTGCKPCTDRTERMQAVAERHAGDATVVRVNAFVRGGEPRAEDLLAERETPPAFRMARDRAEILERRWLDATGHRDRHITFVVDGRGDLAWIGYEADDFEDTVDQIVAGKFDSRRFGKDLRARYDAEQLADPLIWKLTNSAGQGNWDRVAELSAEIMDLHDTYRGYAVTKYHALLRSGQDSKAAIWSRAMLKKHIWDDADALTRLAWMLSDADSDLGEQQRDLELALKVAERADELTGHGRAWVIQGLAQTHFARGDALRASELQLQAVDLEQNEWLKQDAVERLKRFRKAAGLPVELPPPPPAAGPDGGDGGDGAAGVDGADGEDAPD